MSPLGPLWNCWRYRSSQIKKDIRALHDNELKTRPRRGRPSSSEPSHSSQTIITDKQWLSFNTEPWTIVLSKWTKTILQRKQDIVKLKFNDFIETWPLLQNPFGNTLIEVDFDHEYPGKSIKLIEDWDNYSTRIIVMAITKAKKSNKAELSNELSTKSKYAVHENDVKNLENLKAFTALKYILSVERQDGIESVVRFLDVGESIQSRIDTDSSFPKIYVMRDLRDIPTRFYVVYKTIVYSFENFLPSLDMLMKMALTLDVPYPSESETIMIFLQLFFYEIVIEERKNTNSSIYTVVYDLNAEKLKYF